MRLQELDLKNNIKRIRKKLPNANNNMKKNMGKLNEKKRKLISKANKEEKRRMNDFRSISLFAKTYNLPIIFTFLI